MLRSYMATNGVSTWRRLSKRWICVRVISNLSEEKISVDYKIIMLKADESNSRFFGNFDKKEFAPDELWHMGDLVKRATLLQKQPDYLEKGALKFKVQMRLSKGCYKSGIRQHLPDYDYMDISGDDKTSDVAFDLKGEIMVAHKGIIKSKAEDFYVMCEGYSKISPMIIADVDKDIFKIMLNSLYGSEVYPEVWKKHSDSILKAAGKYGFSTLRSEAEVWYSRSLQFTVDNVIGKFMEADGNDQTLVKAAAKKFIMEHGKEVIASGSFERLHESLPLVREVVSAAFESSNKRRREGE